MPILITWPVKLSLWGWTLRKALVCLCALASLCLHLALLQPPARAEGLVLTNEGVIRLCAAGFAQEVVIHKIQMAKETTFRLDVEDLISLKSAGVPGPVIDAMMSRAESETTPAGPNSNTAHVPEKLPSAESSVFLLVDGKRIALGGGPSTDGDARVIVRSTSLSLLLMDYRGPRGRYELVSPKSGAGGSPSSLRTDADGPEVADSDQPIPCEQKEIEPGVWEIRPNRVLAPGSYALLGEGGKAYRFDVNDEHPDATAKGVQIAMEGCTRLRLDVSMGWLSANLKKYKAEDHSSEVSRYQCDGVSISELEIRQVRTDLGQVEWKFEMELTNRAGIDKAADVSYGLWCHDSNIDTESEDRIPVEEDDTNSWSFGLEVDRKQIEPAGECMLRLELEIMDD